MKLFLGIITISFLFYSCNSTQELEDEEIYTFLEICLEDYYKNYDIDLKHELAEFEKSLIEENYLNDSTGASYKKLFKTLKTTNLFLGELAFTHFNNVLLYKNPASIVDCASNVFLVDSTTVAKTNFSKITRQLERELSENEEISIHLFFTYYGEKLSAEELQMPYIKPTIQLLLYRWYYRSLQEKSQFGLNESSSPLFNASYTPNLL